MMEIVYGFFIFLVTTCIGSFLNVVIYRLPLKMSLAFPASHCPTCNHALKWYDNIPILSWIILKGKCRYCNCKISPRYIIVELLTGILSTLIYVKFGLSFTTLFGILILLILIPISFIDIEHLIIPDVFILILLGLGIAGIFLNDLYTSKEIIVIDYKSKLIAAGGAIIFFFIIIGLEKLFKKDLMGGGDLKLLFVAGLLLGWQLLLFMVGVSSILASIIEIIRKSIKNKRNKESKNNESEESSLFPYGPYLAFSMMFVYVFGIELIEWWMGLLTF